VAQNDAHRRSPVTARAYLPEVSERDAEGLAAELYEDIRQVVGLPFVNLVYRHLAVEPRRLEAAWSQLRPNLTDEAIDSGAEALLAAASLDVPVLSAPTLEAVGLDRRGFDAVAATLAAYNHANPRNLIALLALRHGAPGSGSPRPARREREDGWEPLPMADLGSLDAPTLALLEEMTGAVAARGETALIPGLFRHLAEYPGLLALAWTALRPSVEGRALARAANAVARQATGLAVALPHPVEATRDPETRSVLRRFTETIPRMIVVGAALSGTLAAGSPLRR
jgi:hypothetical protein